MSEELKTCPFCGGEIEFISAHFENDWCVHPPTIHCSRCHQNYRGAAVSISDKCDAKREEFADSLLVAWWNHRPAEDALKAELEELRYIVKQFEQWRGDDDTGCPKYQHPDYICLGEKEFKKKFGEDADFDNIECVEWGEGCWVEYYRWKFRQKNNNTDTEKRRRG